MIKRVEKVWGYEEWLENNEKYCVKVLHVRAGYRCSVHYHPVKDETFYVTDGVIFLELNGIARSMVRCDHVRIPPGTPHRFTGVTDAIIVEAGTPHSDDDVVRLTQSERVPAP